jgi:hypothetical protein
MFLFGVAALGIGGAVIGARGHEAERTISKPPGYVYAAMSAMALAGDQHSTEIPGKPYVFRTEKREGKAIGFSIVREGRTIAEVDFTLAPDGADKTRLSAEADIDQAAMADLVGGPRAPSSRRSPNRRSHTAAKGGQRDRQQDRERIVAADAARHGVELGVRLGGQQLGRHGHERFGTELGGATLATRRRRPHAKRRTHGRPDDAARRFMSR